MPWSFSAYFPFCLTLTQENTDQVHIVSPVGKMLRVSIGPQKYNGWSFSSSQQW